MKFAQLHSASAADQSDLNWAVFRSEPAGRACSQYLGCKHRHMSGLLHWPCFLFSRGHCWQEAFCAAEKPFRIPLILTKKLSLGGELSIAFLHLNSLALLCARAADVSRRVGPMWTFRCSISSLWKRPELVLRCLGRCVSLWIVWAWISLEKCCKIPFQQTPRGLPPFLLFQKE